MAYLSELLGRAVRDHRANTLGRLNDLLILPDEKSEYPRVVALALRGTTNGHHEPKLYAWSGNEDLAGNIIVLQTQPQVYTETGHEIYLARDVLDKQVIDVEDHRMVRVNDLELGRIGSDYRLLNVDIGGRGLLRRLGVEDMAERLAERLNRQIPSNAVAWSDLSFLPDVGVRVNVPRQSLRELHPADIAEILEDVGPRMAGELIRDLGDEKIADTLMELETDFQAEVLESFPEERAADIVEEMEPDEAADLLNELEPEKRQAVLNLMEQEEREDVEELLVHEGDTAGGLMTNNFVCVPPGITVGEALERLRNDPASKEAETIYYVYVLDTDKKLLGVCSLSDMVLADPSLPIEKIMHSDPVYVELNTPRDEVLEEISKYNLLAVPVVNQDNQLQGIVTADDALELILPQEWKVKLPRLFR
ncbi:MAG TPA: CBS domain-containing protein [Anaerolineae bacterium]|nr:CBS domain-containing protein [Anaerolineae bacterium]